MMGKQAKKKQQRRAEVALEAAMSAVDEALLEAGIGWHILIKTGDETDGFLLVYPEEVEGAEGFAEIGGSLDDMLTALKRVVIGEPDRRTMTEGNNRLCTLYIPVDTVQAGGSTPHQAWYMHITEPGS